MKTATVKELRQELSTRQPKELLELCLRLSKFKKENKELLTYLLYEASDEATYIENIKKEMTEGFEGINRKSYYFIKKSVRKILRNCKKYIRYSKKKETEVDLLIYFSLELINMKPSLKRSTVLQNLYKRQVESIKKIVKSLHEDLQYDYEIELEEMDKAYRNR